MVLAVAGCRDLAHNLLDQERKMAAGCIHKAISKVKSQLRQMDRVGDMLGALPLHSREEVDIAIDALVAAGNHRLN